MNLVDQPRSRRTARVFTALALTVLSCLAVTAAPAQAEIIGTNHYTLRNVHTDRCLADSFGGSLQVLACAPPVTQHWDDITPFAPTYQFRNEHTDRCVADSFTGGLQVLPCASPNTQKWDFYRFTDGSMMLRNMHTDRCLADSFGGGLQTLPCDFVNSATQRWI